MDKKDHDKLTDGILKILEEITGEKNLPFVMLVSPTAHSNGNSAIVANRISKTGTIKLFRDAAQQMEVIGSMN